jgi:uncharacterized protein
VNQKFLKHILKIIIPALSVLSLTACGGNVTDLAESMLYPFADVNKKYVVPENPPEGYFQVTFDVKASDDTMMSIHSWARKSTNPNAPVVVFFHGNGENVKALYDYGLMGAFVQLNFHFIVIDYPGLGRSTGTPNEANLVNSGLAAIDWAKRSFPRSALYIWGRSLGASVATISASKRQDILDGLVLTSPWNKFIDVAKDRTSLANSLPPEWIAKHGYDSQSAAPSIHSQTIIHHGIDDTLIPIKFGRTLLSNFRANTAGMKELPDIGHNDIFTNRDLWTDVRAFIR